MIAQLSEWESFYVIVGSSAGALTGLQFVVIALISESTMRASPSAIGVFGTPTVVHFGAVLLLSAVLSAPWPTLTGPAVLLGLSGLVGLIYVGMITFAAMRQTAYKPVFEDWLWHNILPLISYSLFLVSGLLMTAGTLTPFFLVAAGAVILLFCGIHNAWDTVTFIVMEDKKRKEKVAEPEADNVKA